jgi:hypothetical protein
LLVFRGFYDALKRREIHFSRARGLTVGTPTRPGLDTVGLYFFVQMRVLDCILDLRDSVLATTSHRNTGDRSRLE